MKHESVTPWHITAMKPSWSYIAVPGERWEVEFLDDGSVEVERFVSKGEIEAEEALQDLFATYADNSGNGFNISEDTELLINTP